MDLVTARAKAVSDMKKHGLIRKGWVFEFDRALYRLGQCDFTRKRITLSKHFTGAANEEQFEQALLHEIAHALLPVGAKHGWDWRLKAKEIGYKGARLASNPYREVRNAETAGKRFRTAAVAGNSSVQRKTAPPRTTPTVGDKLVLPNGVKLTVTEVTASITTAIDTSGLEWNLSTPDAHQFM